MNRSIIEANPNTEQAIANKLNSVLRKRNANAPAEIGMAFAKWGKQLEIKPEFLFAVSMVETGWWKFDGLANKSWNNPAGIKCGCEQGASGCQPGKDGSRFRTYSTIEDGIKHMAAHFYCYVWGDEKPGVAKSLDPCWSNWFKNYLSSHESAAGTPGTSVLATYTLWKQGTMGNMMPSTATVNAVKSILSIMEEAGLNGGSIIPPYPPSEGRKPNWLWLVLGAGALLLASQQKGEEYGNE